MYVLTEEGPKSRASAFRSLAKARAEMARRIRKVLPELGVTPDDFDRLANKNINDLDQFVSPVCRWHVHRLDGALVPEEDRTDVLEGLREMSRTKTNDLERVLFRRLEALLAPDDDAEPPEAWERDYYRVNDDHTVTLLGWMEVRDNNREGFFYDVLPRHTFVYGDWPETFDTSGIDMTDWACPYTQYNEDVHFEDVPQFIKDFFEGQRFEHLTMALVDDQTPPGHYWCRFDEEPGYYVGEPLEIPDRDFDSHDTMYAKAYLEDKYPAQDLHALARRFGYPEERNWESSERRCLMEAQIVRHRDEYIARLIKDMCDDERFERTLRDARRLLSHMDKSRLFEAVIDEFEAVVTHDTGKDATSGNTEGK